jgi:hypothetical protein
MLFHGLILKAAGSNVTISTATNVVETNMAGTDTTITKL